MLNEWQSFWIKIEKKKTWCCRAVHLFNEHVAIFCDTSQVNNWWISEASITLTKCKTLPLNIRATIKSATNIPQRLLSIQSSNMSNEKTFYINLCILCLLASVIVTLKAFLAHSLLYIYFLFLLFFSFIFSYFIPFLLICCGIGGRAIWSPPGQLHSPTPLLHHYFNSFECLWLEKKVHVDVKNLCGPRLSTPLTRSWSQEEVWTTDHNMK